MNDDIDQTGKCSTCRHPIEHYAGVPGNEWRTPFWRHVGASGNRPHAATPDPATVREVTQ